MNGAFLDKCSYLIHDRDTKYCESFRTIVDSNEVKTRHYLHAARI